jgi:hypothetical protein
MPMALERSIDGSEPLRPQPIERPASGYEERRIARSQHLASGTLACPACDAPVAPSERPMSPADAVACPFCDHAGAVRQFLSLSTPGRPARVEVRLVLDRVPG